MADAIMPAEGFDTLLDDETIMEMGVVFGGFLLAGVAQTAAESYLPWDLPNEAYGLGVAYVGFSIDVDHSNQMAIGGGANALDAFAQRFGIQESVEATL
jgi:hypothetical protein